jgi:hypothetical protein
MPLALAAILMDTKIQGIISGLPQSSEELESWNCGEKWAGVAETFFMQGVIPAWTPAGLAVGRALFMAAWFPNVEKVYEMNQTALELGFTAFSTAAAVPSNALPPVVVPPSAPLSLAPLAALPPSLSTMPSTIALHGVLLAWAITGTQTTPAPTPVTLPWS